MKPSKAAIWLSLFVLVLAVVAAGTGLFWQDGGKVFSFTSLHGQIVQLYGQGLYRYDTLLIGAGTRGTDAATIMIEIPLLLLAILSYESGSLRGAIFLAGMLAYFLYYYASLVFGNAYNFLFLLYVALFSASLFALMRVVMSIDIPTLPFHFSPGLPRRGIAAYLLTVGLLLLIAWLPENVSAVVQGQVPTIVGSYTTGITYVLDLGIIVPLVVIAAILLLRRLPLGYLLTSILLVLAMTIGTALIAQGAAQFLAGVPFTPGDIARFMAPFAFLTLVGIWPTVLFFRNFSNVSTKQTAVLRAIYTWRKETTDNLVITSKKRDESAHET